MDKYELPPGWMWTTVGEIAEVKGGKRLPKGSTYSDTPTQYPYIRVTDFENLTINTTDLRFLTPETREHIRQYTISKDDVYISIAGSIGKVGIIPDHLDNANLTENAAKITNLEAVNKKFLCYQLSAADAQAQIGQFTISTNQPKLALFRIQKIEIVLPPLPEQQRIVDEIEAQFTRLDAVVAALKRARANLKRYRASVLKTACEGRLVPQDPSNEPAAQLLERILAERRQQWNGRGPYTEPTPPDTSHLPELPVGWVWTSVDQVANVQTGATPLRKNKTYWENGSIPWVTSAVVNNLFTDVADEFITELALKETNTKIFPAGSLLVAMYGEGKTRGKVSELRIDAATNQALAGLLFEGLAEQCKQFVKLFFQKNYEDIRRLSSGGVQPNLNLSLIRQTCVPLPPLAEQQRIVEEVERRLSVMDEVEATVEANLKRAERLRQSILKRAFEGKLVPQNPADEPASVLLERIKQVRMGIKTQANNRQEKQLRLPEI